MAKKQGVQDSSPEVGGQNEKREKKLAKREAKVMLAVDQARSKLEKAERKLANAQLRAERRKADLQAVEAQLVELRNSHQPARAADNGATPGAEATSESSTVTAEPPEISETGYETPEELLSPDAHEEPGDSTDASSNTGEGQTDEASSEAEAVSDVEDSPASEAEAQAEPDTEDAESASTATGDTGEAAPGEAEAAPTGETEATAQSDESDQTQQQPWWHREPYNPLGEHQSEG